MLSKRSKIVLIVVAVILVMVIIVFYALSRNTSTPVTTGTATPTSGGGSSQVMPGELPTAQTGGGSGGAAIPAYDQTALPIGSVTLTPRVGTSKTPSIISGATKTPITGTVATKTPIVGDLDYTKHQSDYKKLEIDPKIINQIGPNPDPCVLSGIQNSWSNPFAKTICGMEQFLNQNINESLIKMACDFMAAAFSVNLSSNIKSNYINGQCLILDR